MVDGRWSMVDGWWLIVHSRWLMIYGFDNMVEEPQHPFDLNSSVYVTIILFLVHLFDFAGTYGFRWDT